MNWKRTLIIGGLAASTSACLDVDAPARAKADARWMLEYYLAALQEQHFVAHGRFAAHYSSLMEPGVRLTSKGLATARPGIEVRIGGGDARGWSASARHPDFPRCVGVITVGEPESVIAIPARRGYRQSSKGEVACVGDEPAT